MARLTLSMIMRNEERRYLGDVLESAAAYVDDAVIIDDASQDDSVGLAHCLLYHIPHKIVCNSASKFENEVELRKQQWRETLATDPEWVLILDADEMFERSFGEHVKELIAEADAAPVNRNAPRAFYFRLYDMWGPAHYRDDAFWRAHKSYRPFLVRPQHLVLNCWLETPQHCGRFPQEVYNLPHQLSSFRLKHLGWAREEDRKSKFERYMRLDPRGEYGWPDQYKSILDPNPNLVEWIE